jgi:hypothetical protein
MQKVGKKKGLRTHMVASPHYSNYLSNYPSTHYLLMTLKVLPLYCSMYVPLA